jgi:flagellar basal body-associated protein FliL
MGKTEQSNGKESPQRWSREKKIIIVVGLVGLVILTAVLISAVSIAKNTATPAMTTTAMTISIATPTTTPTDTPTMTTTAMTRTTDIFNSEYFSQSTTCYTSKILFLDQIFYTAS